MKIKQNKGMAMLEVLIAMLVVAIGVLPMVYLQIKSDRGTTAAYTKVEHNAAALSIMDMIAADANKNDWVFNLASGDCDGACSNDNEWRKRVTDNLLTQILPNSGSSLVCITQPRLSTAGGTGVTDKSTKMQVTLWWYSSGRGRAEFANDAQGHNSRNNHEGSFVASDCDRITAFANQLNIDTATVTRIF